jgi:hypothetical protein
MRHQSIDKLRTLRLAGMARALEEQMAQADIGQLSFDERLAMLIDREEVDRHNAALAQRLRLAHLRQAVCVEDIDYSTPRGLDRTLIAAWRRAAGWPSTTTSRCSVRRAPARVLLLAHLAIRPLVRGTPYATSASPGYSMNWPSDAPKAVMPAC